MALRYDGQCRRIDLNFRARYPYLRTRIFKLTDSEYQIYVVDDVDNFSTIAQIFDYEIRFATVPVKLVKVEPDIYQSELESISDKNISSNFEGLPLTMHQIYHYITSVHPNVKISKMYEDHNERHLFFDLIGRIPRVVINKVRKTIDNLSLPYSFEVNDGFDEPYVLDTAPEYEVFNILSSQSQRHLNCPFLERDEKFWFENIDSIYDGSLTKEDLFFFDSGKTSCFVDFSVFPNINLRNHILLYDIVYCTLPLAERMEDFLDHQKLKREEIASLTERGRLKIINKQPESRLEYSFINEIFQANPSSVISRRALSTLCAIDLVEMNRNYIFSDPEFEKLLFPFVKEMASLFKIDTTAIGNYLLWPKSALRKSANILNQSGPMGISLYGVNELIIENLHYTGLSTDNIKALKFEFTVHSSNIHLAHALDATYFPFFTDDKKYSDHPYTSMMGNLLNFYSTTNLHKVKKIDIDRPMNPTNPSLDLISVFDINNYIPILEFEENISSSVIRHGMRSLFSELSSLDRDQRNQRISTYNSEVEKLLKYRDMFKFSLDLAVNFTNPIISLIIQMAPPLFKGARNKYPGIQSLHELIKDKSSSVLTGKKNVSILSQINRVARLKEG